MLKNTVNKQEPYVYGSLGGDDTPLVPAKPVATGPQASPQDAVRRDYELALQAGDRDACEAFLQAYPDGSYANLARVQLKKIGAEDARAAAPEKAKQAEDDKAQLVAERAKQAEQDKAAAAANAAEDARIAAEKAKQIEEAKASAAEQRRKEADAAVAKAQADKQAPEKRSPTRSQMIRRLLSLLQNSPLRSLRATTSRRSRQSPQPNDLLP